MPKLLPPDPSQMGAHQKRVYDAIVSGPRGRVRGPLAIWLHRPGLAEHAQALGQYCRYDSSLSPRLSELAILVMAAQWQSAFEWWAHYPIAVKAGVPEAALEQLKQGQVPAFTQADESVVYRFMTALLETRQVSDALYEEAITTLGQDQVVDLVGLSGYYTLISMTLNVFDIQPPEGEAPIVFGQAS